MSLRPHILGFDLGLFRRLLGSGDAAVVERAVAELDRRVGPEGLPEARDIAARGVMTGVPFVGLDAEGDAHVAAAVALSVIDQGRPVFGKRIDTQWSRYGFLDRAEVGAPRAALAPVHAALAGAPEPESLSPEASAQLREELVRARDAIADDQALHAFFERLLAEALLLGDRAVTELASAAAKRRGYPKVSEIALALKRFSGRFHFAVAKARRRRLLPFVEELGGWLERIESAGRDLFLFTS